MINRLTASMGLIFRNVLKQTRLFQKKNYNGFLLDLADTKTHHKSILIKAAQNWHRVAKTDPQNRIPKQRRTRRPVWHMTKKDYDGMDIA